MYVDDALLGRNETISGKIKKASSQLKSSSDKKHDFKIILFIASGINAVTKRDQFIDTIYGSTEIIETCVPHPQTKKCYFFRNSDFYRRKDGLDAAIVGYIYGEKSTLRICLNPYSEHYKLLKESEFLKPFGKAVLDPIAEEKSGRAFIPDSNIDRSESKCSPQFYFNNGVLLHLAKKYKTNILINVDFDSPEYSLRKEL